jgi:hypothetical protein
MEYKKIRKRTHWWIFRHFIRSGPVGWKKAYRCRHRAVGTVAAGGMIAAKTYETARGKPLLFFKISS